MRNVLLSFFVLCCSIFALPAQSSYQPTSTWPYVNPDFVPGTLRSPKGTVSQGLFNVHLLHGTLHFVDNELIKEVPLIDIMSVTIGDDVFTLVNGKMMKIVAKDDNGFVAEDGIIDIATLNSTGGAYGSSSNSIATQALSSLEGLGGNRTNMNHMELKAGKESGKVLPIINKLYIVAGRTVVYASKKDVSGLGIDSAELKSFYKSNKIRWRDPQSLLKVVDFVSSKL